MTDREAFERVMSLMNMPVDRVQNIGEDILVLYDDTEKDTIQFTKCGYTYFSVGALFNKEGKLIKGYLDSHATKISDNNSFLRKLLYLG